MSKLELNDLTSFRSGLISTFNTNNELIEAEFENTISRDGTSPNEMEADFDMNGNRILNLPGPVSDTEPLRLVDLTDFLGSGAISTGAPTNASYVTLGTNATLSAERVLTAGSGISITDAGAGSTVTIATDQVYTPSAFTSTAISTAVSAASSAGGGIVQLEDGDYSCTAAIAVPSNVWIRGSAKSRLLAPADATSISGLITHTGTLGTDTTLASNASVGALTLTLTSAANIAIGDYVKVTVTKVTTSNVHTLITKCADKSGDVITLADPLPFIMLTTDTSTSIRRMTPVVNSRIINVKFIGNGNTGTTRGILSQQTATCAIDGCYFEDFNVASGLWFENGYRNFTDNLEFYDCGSVNEHDGVWLSQTLCTSGTIRSSQASGFGTGISRCCYSSFDSIICSDAGTAAVISRGAAVGGCCFCTFGTIMGNVSSATGVAIRSGCTDNIFDTIIAIGNKYAGVQDVGLWFSGLQDNRNQITNFYGKDNTLDVQFNTNNSDNRILNAIYDTATVGGTGNFLGTATNPAFVLGGYALSVNANAVADTAITIKCPTTNYRISSFIIQNTGTTASLTTAQFGVFTATGGGGTAISAAGQVLSGLTSNAIGASSATVNLTPATTTNAVFNNTTLYFRITQAQGAAATVNVYVILTPLPS